MRSRTPVHRVAPACVAVAASLLLAACGTATLSQDEIQSTIAEQFKAQGVPLTDVSCPDDIEAEVDTPISCTGKNPSGTVLRLEGKVSGIDGDKARFEVKAVGGTAPGATIAAQVKQLLEQQVGQTAKAMTCPDTVEIPTPEPVRCTLTTQDDDRLGVSVTIDEQSKISAKVDGPAQD
ncbi:MAG: DUF4333 domain-containing protein [Solirubrobacteraceae bacterium]|nr:DUF4333 domain-containing protein [Solirubrobacteraceae bacterium]